MAMGRAGTATETGSTDAAPPRGRHPPSETAMSKTLPLLLSLALSALVATAAFAAEKVNINTADAHTIDKVLVGVGPAKAEAIVAYRKEHGSFKSADQLASVKGIGLSIIEKNRDRIVVAGGSAPDAAAPAKGKAPASAGRSE
jgi:competence protein ComEA